MMSTNCRGDTGEIQGRYGGGIGARVNRLTLTLALALTLTLALTLALTLTLTLSQAAAAAAEEMRAARVERGRGKPAGASRQGRAHSEGASQPAAGLSRRMMATSMFLILIRTSRKKILPCTTSRKW